MNIVAPMASATTVPTKLSRARRATLARTRVQVVVPSASRTGNGIGREGGAACWGNGRGTKVVGAAGLGPDADGGGDERRSDGRASWRCSTAAGGGPVPLPFGSPSGATAVSPRRVRQRSVAG